MGVVVFILGRSGTGKSYSMRNFDPADVGVINIQGKILPFRNGVNFEKVATDDAAAIIKYLKVMSETKKSIVIDDFQYLMANEFMRRSTERGYDKFTEIARHAWDVIDIVRTLPNEVIVYVMCHTDTDNEGVERLKTIGRMLDEKIVLEGMSTIVLKTNVSDGQYSFLTQNNGKDTVKSPAGLFPSYAIENDLKYVDEKIRNYYGLGEHLSDDEMKIHDAAAAKAETAPTPRKRRHAETPENTPVSAPVSISDIEPTPTTDAPRRKRRGETTPTIEEIVNEVMEVTPAPTTTPAENPRRRRRRHEEADEMPVEIPGDDDNDGLPFDID